MKILLWMMLPLLVSAQSYDLKSLIVHAGSSSALIKAKEIGMKAKKEEVEAARSAYWPTFDVGAGYDMKSPNTIVAPGGTATAYASLNMELYDGGRKDALLRGKGFEYDASRFEKEAFKKSMTLEIVQHYFTIQKQKANLQALKERSNELKAQIERIRKFRTAGLSSQEDIDKLQAVYDNNAYTIESTELALAQSREQLQLLCGLPVTSLKQSRFKEVKKTTFEFFEQIRMMQAQAHAVAESANAIDAAYKPQVKLSDIYSGSHYNDTASMPGFPGDGLLPDHQNSLVVSMNMRLFDHGRMAKESEAVKYKRLALLSEIEYAKKEQKMNFRLAQKSLRTTRSKLKSAKSALRSAQSTYRVVKQKFNVGLEDNIAYLDALAQKTLTQARYEETLYDYEIGKSIYYYYAGKDPKEFIQ